jgi:peptide/nickel transport system substrate-binding protein
VKLRPLERAAFFKAYSEKKLKNIVQGASGAFGNCATRAEAFVVKGGLCLWQLSRHRRAVRRAGGADGPRQREAILHRLQQLVHDKAIYAPIWQLAFISGVGPRSGNRASG